MTGGNAVLDIALPSTVSNFQRVALAAMEVEIYVRRRLPGVAKADFGWNDSESSSGLAQALARAAGFNRVDAFGAHWHSRGLVLPSLVALRAGSNAKREAWRQIRAYRRDA